MRTKKINIFIVSLCLAASPATVAQLNNLSNADTTISTEEFDRAVTATTTTTTTSTVHNMETIQDLAKETQKSNQRGQQIANTISTLAGVGVAATCTELSPACKWWVAGLVASYVMASNMSKANKRSGLAYKAVTAENPDTDIDKAPLAEPGAKTSLVATRLDGADTAVDLNRSRVAIDRLKKQGWKIDEKKGDITSPKGEKLNVKSLRSAQSMADAGAPASFIKDFTNLPKAAAKKVDDRAKAADGAEGMFSDEIGGKSGRKSPPVVGTADGGIGVYGGPSQRGPKLGIDRDPAQVAGMTKDYKGEKIGVAADSLFHMIDRRYELHQKRGSFIAP